MKGLFGLDRSIARPLLFLGQHIYIRNSQIYVQVSNKIRTHLPHDLAVKATVDCATTIFWELRGRSFNFCSCFNVLLTVHLSIILAVDQLKAQILFYSKFVIFLYMFRAVVLIIRRSNCIIQHLVSSHSVGGVGGRLQSVMIPDAV